MDMEKRLPLRSYFEGISTSGPTQGDPFTGKGVEEQVLNPLKGLGAGF